MDLSPDLRDLLEEFARAKVEYAIVGGYAVAFHARPRTTKDLDVVIGGDAENRLRACEALLAFGVPPSIAEAVRVMSEEDVVYFGQPPLRVDLLRRIDGVTTEAVLQNSVEVTIDGTPLRVIGFDDLVSNKRAAGRPRDLEDVRVLERARATRT